MRRMDCVKMLLLTADVKYMMADYKGNNCNRIELGI
jgi:hypothetical protein